MNFVYKNVDGINYIVFDPSKNITALVDTDVPESTISFIAKKIMDKEPKVEQVGFLYYENDSDISLRMAGGEFCGNATMCAAIYHMIINNLVESEIKVNVYSIKEPINVKVTYKDESEWECTVLMPKAETMKNFVFLDGTMLPIVFFSSIAHVIIDSKFSNDYKTEGFEKYIRLWSSEIDINALGIMIYDSEKNILKPLVYVKSIDTLFWENACASGTTAIGVYLTNMYKKSINVDIKQPSGCILNIFTDENNNLNLKGMVKVI